MRKSTLCAFIGLASYIGPAILFFAPWCGFPAASHSTRVLQISVGAGLTTMLTFWNLWVYFRQRTLEDTIAAIRARGPIGYVDEFGYHPYTEEERAARIKSIQGEKK